MRVYNRRISFIVLLLLCSLFLFSCTDDDRQLGQGSKDLTVTGTPAGEDKPLTDVTEGPGGLVRLKYYTVSATSHSIKNSVVLVGSKYEITQGRIIGLIIDSLEDQSVILSVNSYDIIDGVCIIDFGSSICDIAARDPGLENAILDACAQSILDNIEECTAITFRIDGKAYVTEGHSFAIDHIYMGD